MAQKIIDETIECRSCSGTGLYKGMGEFGDCAVVCSTCDGTGAEDLVFKYTPFEHRKLRSGVNRVFKSSCGYGHKTGQVTTKEGKVIDFDAAGATYEDWLKGVAPKPVKNMYCPKLWTGQRVGPPWCAKHVSAGMSISRCPLYPGLYAQQEESWPQASCWEWFERSEHKDY